jgi:hypothetical protein
MNALTEIESDPLEIDPRDCEFCGRTIDQHRMVDDGDGPQFFCVDDGDVVRQWEMSDPRDRWKHTGETPPPDAVRNSDRNSGSGIAEWPPKRPYRTAQSTIDAFFYVTRNHDDAYLAAWLDRHSMDAAFLMGLWESKNGKS